MQYPKELSKEIPDIIKDKVSRIASDKQAMIEAILEIRRSPEKSQHENYPVLYFAIYLLLVKNILYHHRELDIEIARDIAFNKIYDLLRYFTIEMDESKITYPFSYIATTARNAFIDYCRSSEYKKHEPIYSPETIKPTIELTRVSHERWIAEENEKAQQEFKETLIHSMAECFKKLPEKDRVLLENIYIHERSVEELVLEELKSRGLDNTPENHRRIRNRIDQRRHRAQARLKELLAAASRAKTKNEGSEADD